MKKIKISQVDTIFTNGSYPIEFLIYYKNKLKSKNIHSSLKKLSSAFWPIFGEYHAGFIQYDKYSESKHFDETVMEQAFDRNESAEAIYDKYRQSIPSDLKKLFFLKIIQHKNGTVLIPKLNHLAGDGYSYFFFLSTLATLSHGTSVSLRKNLIGDFNKPHHNRTVLKEFQFNETDLQPLQDKENLTIKFEYISRRVVRNMIKDVAANFNQQVSTNDILSSMVAKKSVTIQKEYFGDDFQLTIPIDIRRQIKEYGVNFFGNGIMFNVINFKSIDIKKSSVNEIAIEIRKSMPMVTKESYIKYLGYIEAIIAKRQLNKLRPYDPNKGCLVTNLTRLPTNKLNFGTGDPDFIFPLTIEKNSTAILANKDNFILRLAY